MEPLLKITLVSFSIVFLIIVFIFVRKRKLILRYALIWIMLGLSFTILAIFPGIITLISRLTGVISNNNVVYLMVIFALILIILLNTTLISGNDKRIRQLIKEISILKKKVEDMKNGMHDEEK